MKNAFYFLSVLFFAVGLYGIEMKLQNKQLEQAIHGRYMNDLSEASQSLQQLESEVSQSLIFQDERALNTSLNTIWRVSNDLKTSLAKLPLQQNVATAWNNYVGKIGESAKLAATNDNSDWRTQMGGVQKNLQALTEQWDIATASLYEQDGNYKKWAAVALDEKPESPFMQSATSLKTYQETDFPLTASESDYEKKRDLQNLIDKQLTKDEVVTKFTTLFPAFKKATMNVSKSDDEAPYPFYQIQFARGTKVGYVHYTEKGGHLLSYLVERPFGEETLSHEEIKAAAERFLQKAEFTDVAYVEGRENTNVWHLVYARVAPENDALIYPDAIQLKVAKDNGDIIGVNTMEYVQKETLAQSEIVPLDKEQFFASHATIAEERLIYTENMLKQLRLCYEFIVHEPDQQSTYRLVVDAENHEVIKVEKLP